MKTNKDKNNLPEEDVVFESEDENENPAVLLKKLREKIKKLESEKQEYLNGWQKDKAEFINLRKKDEESKIEFIKFANQNLISQILPILDSFENAFALENNGENVPEKWKDGIKSIHNQLLSVLTNNGVKKFSPDGGIFDPTFHEAVSMEKTTNKDDDGKVMKVLQTGYEMGGKVLRPAKVVVGEYIEK